MIRLPLLTLVLLLVAAATHAKAPSCEARFLVQGESLFGGAPEIIDLKDGTLSIRDHCGGKKVRVRAKPDGERMRARFSAFCPANQLCPSGDFIDTLPRPYPRWISLCEDKSNVRVKAVVDPTCRTLTGRLRSRSPRVDREFVATVSPLAPECVPTLPGASCGCSTAAADCSAGAFCDAPSGMCRFASAYGECMPVPAECPAISSPVCGCDGVTYANECARRAAQVAKDHHGACEDAP